MDAARLEAMNDYARVESLLRHLEAARLEQPSVSDLARLAGVGETQVHRLFQRWAGITPKDFLQCLTVEDAKRRLRASTGVLDTALEVGLSGPGRLHDLMVTLEAASPGEFKDGGAGRSVGWGVVSTPFGRATVGWTERGLTHLAFTDADPSAEVPQRLRDDWPKATWLRDDDRAAQWAVRIFPERGSDPSGGLRAHVRATPFQIQVWRALLRIPEGALTTYGRIAAALGREGAARAVGTACGANPIGFLIPCHRVIRETGAVDGYRWGTPRKRILLAYESATTAPL
jgi:AraC family transcriptional regulator of adaptative response/methylated-DNA-[protein]-cysteine methyltransferase